MLPNKGYCTGIVPQTLYVSGKGTYKVTLILDADKTLTTSKGIEVDEGNTLTIEGNVPLPINSMQYQNPQEAFTL